MYEFFECDHTNESFKQPSPVGLFIMLYKEPLNFECVNEMIKCDHSNQT